MTEPKPGSQIASTLITLLLFVAVVAMAATLVVKLRGRQSPTDGGAAGPLIGMQVPKLELQPLTGTTEPKNSLDLRGKVTLLNLWGTWCPYCVQEMPHLAGMVDEIGDQPDFQFLSVSYGNSGEDFEKLKENTQNYLAMGQYKFPTYFDQKFTTFGALSDLSGSEGFPQTFVIDRRGTIRGYWAGFHPDALPAMKQLLMTLLQEPKPAATSTDPYDVHPLGPDITKPQASGETQNIPAK